MLRIFSDICEAVGQLHVKDPPISHRDLKLENLLLHPESGSYKLCDFGSCRAGPLRVSSKAEMLAAEEEIQKFTTPAYRAPEMVDLYSGSPINEKVDIWVRITLFGKQSTSSSLIPRPGARLRAVQAMLPCDSIRRRRKSLADSQRAVHRTQQQLLPRSHSTHRYANELLSFLDSREAQPSVSELTPHCALTSGLCSRRCASCARLRT